MSSALRAPQPAAEPGLEFLDFLASQRADYRRGIAAKSAGMATLWSLVADGHDDGSAVLELERQAHGMAGSAATFGFSDLGLAARTLELALHPLLDRHGAPSAAQCSEIAAAMLGVIQRIPAEQSGGPGPC